MQYLVICTDPQTGKRSAFLTNWYDYENNYAPEMDMVIVDCHSFKVAFDGKTWEDIEFDHL